jgi:Flp pilus assembly protein TadD
MSPHAVPSLLGPRPRAPQVVLAIVGALCLAACAPEPTPAPPAPQPSLPKAEPPTTSSSPKPAPAQVAPATAWPTTLAPDAYEPILDAVRANAVLPKVPTIAASSTQRQALVQAKNLSMRLSLRFELALAHSLARNYQENLFPDRSLQVLGLCLESKNVEPLTLKLLAGSLSAEGRFADALAVLEHLTRLTPNDAGLAGPLFVAHWELGQLPQARQALARGLELAPFMPHLELAMGRVLFAEDNAEEALPFLQRATESLPNETEAWYRLALCLDELGETEAAADAHARHARLDQMKEFSIPTNLAPRARREALIAALVQSGDFAGAERERAALLADTGETGD